MNKEKNSRQEGILIITHGSSDLAADQAFSDLLYSELKDKYPEALVCQAYSAPKTLQRIDRGRTKTPVNTVPEMLEYMQAEGVTELCVIAANLNPCKKYARVLSMIDPCRSAFSSVRISPPLLNPEEDPVKIAGVLGAILKDAANPDTNLIVLAAHTANEEITELWKPVTDQLTVSPKGLGEYPAVRELFYQMQG